MPRLTYFVLASKGTIARQLLKLTTLQTTRRVKPTLPPWIVQARSSKPVTKASKFEAWFQPRTEPGASPNWIEQYI